MLRILFLLAVLATTTPAADLLTNAGDAGDAELVAIDKQSATLTTDNGERRLAWREIVRWGSPAKPPLRPRVVLHNGSQIVVAPPWSRNGSLQLVDDKLEIQSITLDNLELPRANAARLLFEAARDPQLNATPVNNTAPTDADLITLVDGDVLRGELTGVRGGEAVLVIGGEAVPIELKRIAAARLGPQPERSSRAKLVVGLKDGSLLYAAGVETDRDRVKVTLAGTGSVVSIRKPSDVHFLQPLDGGAVYLSDLTPLDYRHTPYTSVAWPLALDTNLAGGPLQAGGRRYLKGVAMHSPSRLVYRLPPGEFDRLEFAMAIDDAAGDNQPGGSVVFRVLVARDSGFEPAFTSPVVRSGDAPRAASVDVAAARAVALIIEPADFGDRQDHADWLDARLIRNE